MSFWGKHPFPFLNNVPGQLSIVCDISGWRTVHSKMPGQLSYEIKYQVLCLACGAAGGRRLDCRAARVASASRCDGPANHFRGMARRERIEGGSDGFPEGSQGTRSPTGPAAWAATCRRGIPGDVSGEDPNSKRSQCAQGDLVNTVQGAGSTAAPRTEAIPMTFEETVDEFPAPQNRPIAQVTHPQAQQFGRGVHSKVPGQLSYEIIDRNKVPGPLSCLRCGDWIVVPLGWHLHRDAKGLRIIFEAWRDERERIEGGSDGFPEGSQWRMSPTGPAAWAATCPRGIPGGCVRRRPELEALAVCSGRSREHRARDGLHCCAADRSDPDDVRRDC